MKTSPRFTSPSRRGAILGGWLAVLGVLALAGAMQRPLGERLQVGAAPEQSDTERGDVNSSPLGMMLGEMRAGMADLMWVKTERYLHRGVAFRPHIDTAELARTGQAVHQKEHPVETAAPAEHEHDEHEHAGEHVAEPAEHEHDEHCTHDHAAETPLVPVAANDWRGLSGDLHRAIKPWQSANAPHEHTSGEELLPWYRLMTLSNPHHWRAYMVGTWWLWNQEEHDPQALDQAQAFIAEGIRNNPKQFQLRMIEGRLLMHRERFREALASFEQAVDLGMRQRPAGGATNERWITDDEEDFRMALRYVPLLLARKLGDEARARTTLRAALTLAPGDGPLNNMAAQMGVPAPGK